jgi:hypothetical protein
MRKGEMSAEDEIVKANKSKRAVETRIKINSRGIALFIAVTNAVGVKFCLKAFLSRFLDSEIEVCPVSLTK